MLAIALLQDVFEAVIILLVLGVSFGLAGAAWRLRHPKITEADDRQPRLMSEGDAGPSRRGSPLPEIVIGPDELRRLKR